MGAVLGLHLVQQLALVDSPRRSVIARLDDAGRLDGLWRAGSDDDVAARVAEAGGAALVVDAPLAVPSERGRRDVEVVLSWCDVSAFPVSARRLRQVTGGTRGADLAAVLAAPGRWTAEGLPDQVLRQIAWERDHPPDAPPIDLGAYRTAWIGVRAPAYRPKGAGRARPEGLTAAWTLLAGVVDLGGWHPAGAGGDRSAVDDAGVIDAVCCAYAARRVEDGSGVLVGSAERGRMALPADANLRDRLALTLGRLRAEGAIAV